MASHVQHNGNGKGASAASIAVTLGSAVTPGNLIIIETIAGNFSTLTDDLANAYTLAYNSGQGVRLYYLANCPNAPITFTLTVSPNQANLGIVVHEVSGAGVAPFRSAIHQLQTAPGTGANVVSSTAIIPGVDGAYILGTGTNATTIIRTPPMFTAGTSPIAFTKGYSGAGVNLRDQESEYFIQESSASIAATFTFGHATDNTYCSVSAWGTPTTATTGLRPAICL